MWTLGGIVFGFFYKDKLTIEVIKSLYICEQNGQQVENFKDIDLFKKKILCWCKNRRNIELEKTIGAGKDYWSWKEAFESVF
jgi:hypothetical protein